jgi:transketolase
LKRMKTDQEIQELCRTLRRDILKMIHKAKTGHPGGSLSSVEILAVLYNRVMRIDPNNPNDPDRDRFILSKGHIAPALYAVLARKGYFGLELLDTLRKLESPLQGHPYALKCPGLDCSSGSLGQGLSVANGLAIAARKRGAGYRTYCLLGDGEIQEGQIWEAAMSAAHFKLDNICAIVDYNKVQLDGTTDEIMNIDPVVDKWKAFNWNVITCDGHDIAALSDAFKKAQECRGKPSVIVARCIKGKGVSFMENKAAWHGLAPNDTQLAQALEEIG